MSKIALVSYFGPPQLAVASHRIIRLSRTLLEAGHDVHLVTMDPDQLPKRDPTLEALLPSEVRLHGFGGPNLVDRDARNFVEKVHRTWIFKLPDWRPVFDRHVEWSKTLIKQLPRLVESEGIDTVLLCCGPHGQLEAVPALRRRFGDRLRILIDYRDLLSGNTWRQSKSESIRQKVCAKEKAILSQVDALTVNNDDALTAFQQSGAMPDGLRVEVARNAACPEVAKQVFDMGEVPDLGPGIHLGFFGTIFPKRRLLPVLQAMAVLPDELRQQIRLHVYCDATTSKDLLDEDLCRVPEAASQVTRFDYLGYGDALRMMRAMDGLILINSPEQADQIFVPGKLYDYMMAERPILFVGGEGNAPIGDAARIVAAQSGPEACFTHSQVDGVAEFVRSLGTRPAGSSAPRAVDRLIPEAYRPESTFRPILDLCAQPVGR
ncbi:MAG: hypothetical protein AAF196_08800 [Planctomycetota bacterium]